MTWTKSHILDATKNAVQINNVTQINTFRVHTKDLQPQDAFIALPPWPNNHGGAYIPEAARKGAIIVYDKTTPIKPTTDTPSIQVPCIKTMLQQLAHFRSQFITNKKIILTGSHGKTTTKEVLRQLVPGAFVTQENFNTDISLCLTNINAPLDAPLYVFESGITQLHEMDHSLKYFCPQSIDAAIITSIAPVHLEFLKTIENIIEQKTKIFSLLKHTGFAIVEGDRPYTHDLTQRAQPFSTAYFGENDTCDLRIQGASVNKDGSFFSLTYKEQTFDCTTPLLGTHMVRNVACAILALLKTDLCPTQPSLQRIIHALPHLQPYTGRGTLSPFQHGIIHNYSYAAGSLVCVRPNLEAFSKIPAKMRYLVIGDMAEQGADRVQAVHEELAQILQKTPYDHLYLVGPIMQSIVPQSEKVHHEGVYSHIVEDIKKHAIPGTRVFVQGSRSFALEHFVDALSLSTPQ